MGQITETNGHGTSKANNDIPGNFFKIIYIKTDLVKPT